jgi:hypothetical protein
MSLTVSFANELWDNLPNFRFWIFLTECVCFSVSRAEPGPVLLTFSFKTVSLGTGRSCWSLSGGAVPPSQARRTASKRGQRYLTGLAFFLISERCLPTPALEFPLLLSPEAFGLVQILKSLNAQLMDAKRSTTGAVDRWGCIVPEVLQ